MQETLKEFKAIGLSKCFVLNLKITDENCSIFNCHNSWAAPGISFFQIPTTDDFQVQSAGPTLLQLLTVMGDRWQLEKANWKPNIADL